MPDSETNKDNSPQITDMPDDFTLEETQVLPTATDTVKTEQGQDSTQVVTKKLLLIGIGYFLNNFITRVVGEYDCIVVCPDNVPEVTAWQEYEHVTFYNGDVNSIVLWKKLPLDEVSHIIFSHVYLSDPDVIEEVCKTAREIFKLEDVPIIGIGDRKVMPDFYDKYNVIHIDPVDIGVGALKNLINSNYIVPTNIGLSKGELIEVTIFRRSHLINRKLKYMESVRWRVAAIYRDGELVIPTGSSELNVGDRVVLVGDPVMLVNIVKVLMQGVPQFPKQYGNHINVIVKDDRDLKTIEEINYFNHNIASNGFYIYTSKSNEDFIKNNTQIHDMDINGINIVDKFLNKSLFNDAGLIVYGVPVKFGWFNRSVRRLIRYCSAPLLLSKGVFPYSCIIVSLNCEEPSQVLQSSMEIASHLTIPIKIIYAAPPKDLRNSTAEEELEYRQNLVKEFENIDRTKFEYSVLEGNPVRESVLFQSQIPRALFIIGNSNKKIGIFEPHIPYLLSQRLTCSLLLLPFKD